MDLAIEEQGQNNSTIDTGLACFIVAMAHLGPPVKEAELREKIGDQAMENELLREKIARMEHNRPLALRRSRK